MKTGLHGVVLIVVAMSAGLLTSDLHAGGVLDLVRCGREGSWVRTGTGPFTAKAMCAFTANPSEGVLGATTCCGLEQGFCYFRREDTGETVEASADPAGVITAGAPFVFEQSNTPGVSRQYRVTLVTRCSVSLLYLPVTSTSVLTDHPRNPDKATNFVFVVLHD